MPDYSKCLIYYITSGDNLYVGSTCNLNRRRCKHKHAVENPDDPAHNRKLYRTIRDNGDWDMQIYEEFPCETKTQMRIREEEVRIELRADLNEVRCYTSPEKKKELKKQHYEINKEDIKEKRRDYYKNYSKYKECETARNWYENNKEKKKEYMKQRYADNKNRILTTTPEQSSSESSDNEIIN